LEIEVMKVRITGTIILRYGSFAPPEASELDGEIKPIPRPTDERSRTVSEASLQRDELVLDKVDCHHQE